MNRRIKKIVDKLHILRYAINGNIQKYKFLFNFHIRKKIDLSAQQDSNLVVSLTSYGYRARHCVAYSIYSIMKQRVRPGRIILWLGDEEFVNEPLPKQLVFLQKYGLEIRFCEDMKSYKKLIPALNLCGDKNIITIDDDIYYTPNLIESLLDAHEHNPDCIIAGQAAIPQQTNGIFVPYTTWEVVLCADESLCYDRKLLFPLGYSGIFYPVGVFDNEATNKDVFLSLSPLADDVWFYVMGLRRNVDKVVVPQSKVGYYHTDLFRQMLRKDRLHDKNFGEGKNDIQLRALIQHYNICLG